MRLRRSIAASRVTQPRSTATRMAMMPKPEPPMATLSSAALARVVHRSGASPLTGCAPSQKKWKVWRCTISSRGSSGSVASAAASIVSAPNRGMGRTRIPFPGSRFCPVSANICVFKDAVSMSRIEQLMARMTLVEKLGQLTMAAAGHAVTGPVISGDSTEAIRNGAIGNLLNLVGAGPVREMQRLAVEESRLKIPLLIGLDIIHGHRTLFPIPLAEAALFDPQTWEATARE